MSYVIDGAYKIFDSEDLVRLPFSSVSQFFFIIILLLLVKVEV